MVLSRCPLMVGMLMLWSIVTPARAQNVIAMHCPNAAAPGLWLSAPSAPAVAYGVMLGSPFVARG